MDPEPKNLNGPVEPSWTQNACACGPMDPGTDLLDLGTMFLLQSTYNEYLRQINNELNQKKSPLPNLVGLLPRFTMEILEYLTSLPESCLVQITHTAQINIHKMAISLKTIKIKAIFHNQNFRSLRSLKILAAPQGSAYGLRPILCLGGYTTSTTTTTTTTMTTTTTTPLYGGRKNCY